METSKIKSRNHLLLTGSDGFFLDVFCVTQTPCGVTGRSLEDGSALYGLCSGCPKKCHFLTILVVGKSKIKALASLVPGERSRPAFQMADFWLCSHMAESKHVQTRALVSLGH